MEKLIPERQFLTLFLTILYAFDFNICTRTKLHSIQMRTGRNTENLRDAFVINPYILLARV